MSLHFLSDLLLWCSEFLSACCCMFLPECSSVHFPYERPCGRKVGHMQSERHRLRLKCLSLSHPLKISVLIESPSIPRPQLVITPFNETHSTMLPLGPMGSLCTLSLRRALQKLTGGCNISQNNGSSLRGVLIQSYRTHHHYHYLLERLSVPALPR